MRVNISLWQLVFSIVAMTVVQAAVWLTVILSILEQYGN